MPPSWHSQRVLQVLFNPNTTETTAQDHEAAAHAMAVLVSDTPVRLPIETMVIHEDGEEWEGADDYSVALVVTEVARTTKRPRYNGSLKWQLSELVTQQLLAGLPLSVYRQHGSDFEVDDINRLAMSLVCLDPDEPDDGVRGEAQTAMLNLGKKSAAALVRALIVPARWTPAYAHTNPDSDGWQEILRWCTGTFPTRAHAEPWMTAGFDPLTAMDYRLNGFTPEAAAPWRTVFPVAHTASAWAAAGVPIDRAGPYLRAGYTCEEAGVLERDPATRPALDVLSVSGALNTQWRRNQR